MEELGNGQKLDPTKFADEIQKFLLKLDNQMEIDLFWKFLDANTISRVFRRFAELLVPAVEKIISTREISINDKTQASSQSEINEMYLVKYLASLYAKYHDQHPQFEIIDGKLYVFTLDTNKRVIVLNSIQKDNNPASLKDLVADTHEGLSSVFKMVLEAQARQEIIIDTELYVNLFSRIHTADGYKTAGGFYKSLLKSWNDATISEYFQEKIFDGKQVSKADYLIMDQGLTRTFIKQLGIDADEHVFSTDGKPISFEDELFGSFRIITNKETGKKGLIEVSGDTIRTPEGWTDGLFVDGQWIHNALLTTKEGKLLSSRFFNPQQIKLGLKEDNWLVREFLDYLYEEKGTPCGVDLLTVFSLTEGDAILNHEMLVHLINPSLRTDSLNFELTAIREYFYDLYTPPIPQIALLAGGTQPPSIVDSVRVESDYKNELDNLALMIYQIQNFNPDQRDVFLTEGLLDLHIPGESKYSIQGLTDLFKTLGLIQKDLTLGEMYRNQKAFYGTLQTKILEAITKPGVSEDIKASLQLIFDKLPKGTDGAPITLTDNIGFTDTDEYIVRILDAELNKLFGYIGYSLLGLGLLKFDGMSLRFELPNTITEFQTLLKRMGLKSIAYTSIDYNRDTLTNMDMAHIVLSIVLSGQFKSLMKVDENGKFTKWSYLYTLPGEALLTEIFGNDLHIGELIPSYHFAIMSIFTQQFLNERFEHDTPIVSKILNCLINKDFKKFQIVFKNSKDYQELSKNLQKYIKAEDLDFETLKIEILAYLVSNQNFIKYLKKQDGFNNLNPHNLREILSACGIDKYPSRLSDYDFLKILKISMAANNKGELKGDWADSNNEAYAFLKIYYKNQKVDTGMYFANSKKMEMFGVEKKYNFNKMKLSDIGYPDHLITSNLKAKIIYEYLFRLNEWTPYFGSLQWQGFHAEAKILVAILDHILNNDGKLKKGIERIDLQIASLLGYCDNCYEGMAQFKKYLEEILGKELGLKVNIYLRNREAKGSTYVKTGAIYYQIPYFTDKYEKIL